MGCDRRPARRTSRCPRNRRRASLLPLKNKSPEFDRSAPPGVRRGSVFNPFLFDATDAELQRWLLTALVVAGKQSHIQEQKLGGFYSAIRLAPGAEPFPVIARLSPARLRAHLEEVRMGQYNRLTRAFGEVSRAVVGGALDLRTCTRGQLAGFPGIGLKTASYFLLYTRPGARVACIDTHILAWLAERHPEVPRSTPQNLAAYAHWENLFLRACDLAQKTPAAMDFEIWLARKTAREERLLTGE